MTWVDYAVAGVMALSIAWGVWRGFVREAVSLAGWVIAFLAANAVASPLGEWLPGSIESPEVRMLIAFLAVFIVTLSAMTLAGVALARLIKSVGLDGLDRTLGGVFGLARALVVLLALTIVAGLTRLPQQPSWKESVSAGVLSRTVVQLRPWLPPRLAERLRYH